MPRPFKRCPCPVVKNARGDRLACKKDHGSWAYVVDLGRGPDGKRKQERKGGFRTQKEAQKSLDELLARVRSGRYHPDERKTVGEWLNEWLERKVHAGLRPSTARSYEQHIRTYIAPRIGHKRLRDLKPGDVTQMHREIAAMPNAPGPATIRRVNATLASALSSAVKAQIVTYNAAKLVDLPKAERPKVNPWEPAQLGAFLDHVASDRIGPLYEFLALTGLRRGEALRLRWRDVDLDRGVIVVRQSKTKAGEGRRVNAGPELVGVLLAHKLAQDAERSAWGTAYQDDDLVFAREDGQPLDPTTVTKRFRRLAAEAGVRPVRLHDLRHGAASLMLSGGLGMEWVSKRLGHSGIGITIDTYAHMLEDVNRRAGEVTEAMVPRGRRDRSVTTSPNPQENVPPQEDVSAGQEARPPRFELGTFGLEVRCSIR